jgi:hypothetical protein
LEVTPANAENRLWSHHREEKLIAAARSRGGGAFVAPSSGAQFSAHSSHGGDTVPASRATEEKDNVMERRHFLKIAFGVAAGAATFAATAQAAPMVPLSEDALRPSGPDAHPAVTTGDEVDHLKPEQVRWHHRYWHRRHWGWRHRHWHRRHWRRW